MRKNLLYFCRKIANSTRVIQLVPWVHRELYDTKHVLVLGSKKRKTGVEIELIVPNALSRRVFMNERCSLEPFNQDLEGIGRPLPRSASTC